MVRSNGKKLSSRWRIKNENWDKEFEKAKKKAENEMKRKSDVKGLTWQEVFINKYTLLVVLLIIVYSLINSYQ